PAPPASGPVPPPAPPRPAGSAPPPPAPAPSQVAAAASPPPPPVPSGRIQVQLAAVPSEQAATAEWNRLRRRMPELLATQSLVVSRGEREGQPFWRVRTGAFEDNASARAFCERVKAAGGSCFVAPSG
ncbi:SPOR domain-containing protein, partial [Elioraea rosea]|uniref:SPOR domain-containing protein n=1 Tax=Elioraea rosea TaxID=2492390 RepID=UPI001186D072